MATVLAISPVISVSLWRLRTAFRGRFAWAGLGYVATVARAAGVATLWADWGGGGGAAAGIGAGFGMVGNLAQHLHFFGGQLTPLSGGEVSYAQIGDGGPHQAQAGQAHSRAHFAHLPVHAL